MKTTCPRCKRAFSARQFIQTHRSGVNVERKCPSCGCWFRLTSQMAWLHIAGLLGLLIPSLANLALGSGPHQIPLALASFLGGCVALGAMLYGKMVVVRRRDHH
ncbi:MULTISPECIES: hypothetical protein [unclassified Hahella]|uniref:hypothetical protein n=1 Tax=unclassified Hahella TaxID=2624107 RepID=UPI001C1EB3A3|nr:MULTISPECIES: hypothetical protein [unclassified Hahella]MBU6951082.1 hypothetical protein [Hahella sp. HN01]MDG9666813.1 hypothetical protein [Hahella sp. CR1]